jgi:hypothetical protein
MKKVVEARVLEMGGVVNTVLGPAHAQFPRAQKKNGCADKPQKVGPRVKTVPSRTYLLLMTEAAIASKIVRLNGNEIMEDVKYVTLIICIFLINVCT